MLLVKEILQAQEQIEVSCTYTSSVKTYNIVTDFMSDDCKSIQLGNGICIWLDDEGRLGEIECIYPKIGDHNPSAFTSEIKVSDGIPSMGIGSLECNGYVEQHTERFVIWFSENQKVEQEIWQGSIRYLLFRNQLVGIAANSFETIE